ncbi:hypothetical protein CGRA01v4_15133 [Colletotrichum graminicola]|nr:hypothetical protein CGRA01v4_15133 [Colletotrichum graminicola]
MGEEYYFHRVSTPIAYNSEAKPDGDWLKSLNRLGASTWGRPQLVALRVLVVETDASLLPSLNEDKDFVEASSMLRFDQASESDPRQEDDRGEPTRARALFKLVKGPPYHDRVTRSVRTEYALRRDPLGSVWAAMNRLCLSGETDDSIDSRDEEGDDVHEAHETPSMGSSPPVGGISGVKRDLSFSPLLEQRPKRQATQAPLAPTYNREELTEAIGPSSPSQHLSSSQSHIPQEEAVKSPQRPEDLTHRFASEFIRYVLEHLPQSDWSDSDDFAVDFDDLKLELHCRIQREIAYRSIDDGGLSLVQDFGERLGRVAILETKGHLGKILDGVPKLSDERFAQIIGQAVSMRLARRKWVGPQDTHLRHCRRTILHAVLRGAHHPRLR